MYLVFRQTSRIAENGSMVHHEVQVTGNGAMVDASCGQLTNIAFSCCFVTGCPEHYSRWCLAGLQLSLGRKTELVATWPLLPLADSRVVVSITYSTNLYKLVEHRIEIIKTMTYNNNNYL